jgi:hypothetical protein
VGLKNCYFLRRPVSGLSRLTQVFDQHEIRTGDPDLRMLGPAVDRRDKANPFRPTVSM